MTHRHQNKNSIRKTALFYEGRLIIGWIVIQRVGQSSLAGWSDFAERQGLTTPEGVLHLVWVDLHHLRNLPDKPMNKRTYVLK